MPVIGATIKDLQSFSGNIANSLFLGIKTSHLHLEIYSWAHVQMGYPYLGNCKKFTDFSIV